MKLLGEQGTQIYDEMKECNPVNNYHDRSNVMVTLFDNMIYNLRIELYCVQSGDDTNSYNQDSWLADRRCNYAQYLGVWIDFNNDGVFDENQEMIPNVQYEQDERTNEYDLRIAIPQADGRNYLTGQHRMRIILSADQTMRRSCYSTGNGEARDYTVQIERRLEY